MRAARPRHHRPARDRGRGHGRRLGRAARAGRRRAGHHRAHRRHHPQPRRHDGRGARGHAARARCRTSWPSTRQHVSLDAARVAEGATVGGLLATGDAGPAALVYGSLRDLVIGVTLVLADGTVARAGGHVIKNVAGYDMAKVVHGSYGTLAVVAEVVLRLHPVPKAAVTLQLPCSLAEAAEVAARVLRRPRRARCAGVDQRRPAPAADRGHRRRAGGARRAGAGAARRAAAVVADRPVGPARRAHPRATRPPPCCGSACGRRGCPRCSPRCPRWRPPRAGHRRRDGHGARGRRRRRPRARARRGRHLRAARPSGRARTWPPGGRRRRRSACCAPSNTPSTPTTASDPAASTPGCDPDARRLRRPTAHPRRELLDDCVHCGFCLPTCPTYQLWGEEMDSPRGRIYLMSLAEKGEIGLEGPFATHIDRCLGCMACVTACPSGVQYDRLLEATRPQIERNGRARRDDRLFRDAIFALFPYKRRLRAAAAARRRSTRSCAEDPGDPARSPSGCRAGSRRWSRCCRRSRVRDAFARLPVHTPAVGHPARPGRAAHRLRAGRVLPPRQRGHRAGARRRGLGRARAPRPAVLRGAGAALRPRGARAGPGPARDRRLRAT